MSFQVADETDSVRVAFATERALWSQEKAALKLALAQAEADAVHGRRIGGGADTSEQVSCCNFLLLERLLYFCQCLKAMVFTKVTSLLIFM
jgi:hypothetical protein